MLLPQEKSLCKHDQKIIVSKDKGSSRRHRAINTGQQYYMQQSTHSQCTEKCISQI